MKATKSIGLGIGLFVLAGVVQAHAHAFLEHADPRVGSIIGDSPKVIKMWFTEELEPSFSKAQVLNAKGEEVDNKDSGIEGTERTVMTVSLPPHLPPGVYKVVWHAVAVDTHHTTGTFTFTVKK